MTDRSGKVRFTNLGHVCLFGTVVMFGSSLLPAGDAALRSSFETALKNKPAIETRSSSGAPVAGTEDYWLSAVRGDAPGPVMKTVAIGDEINFSVGGERRTFKVQSVSDYTPPLTTIDTGDGHSQFVLVTAKDKVDPAALAVRFLVEVERTGNVRQSPQGRTS